MGASNACIVFAKWPEPGKVKTRLAVGSSESFAARFYKACCEATVSECQSCEGWRCRVAYSPASDKERFQEWLNRVDAQVTAFQPQVESVNLGNRMHASLSGSLAAGYRKVILVGSDIPDLQVGILSAAFQILEQSQVVLGPAVDGGFYLIGATVMPPGLLEGITWSTVTVLQDTVANCRAAGLSVDASSLPRLQDIDTYEDLTAWLATVDDSHSLKTTTQQLIAEELEGSMR